LKKIKPAMRMMNRRRFLAGSAGLALARYSPAFGQYAVNVPRSSFDATSTAEEVTANIDLTGKTALVTGCNSGIGYETMRVLAQRGAHVIGTARSMEKGKDACESVEGRCTPLLLELTDFDSVVACTDQVQAMDVPLDILVCNAGVLFRDLQQARSLEMHFVVNHLGHFILVNRLLDEVAAAPEGRVVVVSSVAHRNVPAGGIQFDDLSGRGWATSAYGHSKLANGLFSLELARQFEGTRATSNSLHPGRVDTNIFRNVAGRLSRRGLKTVEEGAATTCYVATNTALAGVSGYYFSDCNPQEPTVLMQDTEMAGRLWEVSENLVRDYLA
jgi:NAD(P)-dependent dehydrogenase (short-subunit alcohol dehydrogenase family)